MEAGRPAAGSSRTGAHRASTTAHPWRLDPFSLPVRFTTADAAADEGLRIVDLHRERVVLRRALSGARMAVNLPVAAYRGVAIRLDATAEMPPMVRVTLEHAGAALSLPLFASEHLSSIAARARSPRGCGPSGNTKRPAAETKRCASIFGGTGPTYLELMRNWRDLADEIERFEHAWLDREGI